MKNKKARKIAIAIVSVVFVAYLCLLTFGITSNITVRNTAEKLGGAICLEEYGQEFKSYNFDTNELVCKPFDAKEEYDGVKVVLNKKILEK